MRYPIHFAITLSLTSVSAFAEIRATDCVLAAKYSESKRGVSMLVMQNGRTLAEPGASFIYGPSHLQIFSELLRRKLGGRSTIAYFEGHVSDRLGLGRLNYKKDARGNPLPATGFELTAREWARLGELILGNGSYRWRQIVPANLFREALAGSQANPSYGLTFWLNSQAANGREADLERMLDLPWQSARWTDVCICKDAPPDMVVALGSHYQRLFIIPSLKAIVVRQGSEAKFFDAHFLRLVLGREG